MPTPGPILRREEEKKRRDENPTRLDLRQPSDDDGRKKRKDERNVDVRLRMDETQETLSCRSDCTGEKSPAISAQPYGHDGVRIFRIHFWLAGPWQDTSLDREGSEDDETQRVRS